VRLAGAAPQRMTPARSRVLALLADGMARGKSEAAREAGVTSGVVDGLIDEGTLETLVLPPEPVAQNPDPDFKRPDFTAAQSAAAAALKATLAKGGYAVTLLDGVTGSGKTEVYFEAVADTIRSGRQSLILMPEIALALRAVTAATRPHLARSGRRRGFGRSRRALGAVSALRRSRPGRGR
jgi:primosomal protein N' (replication factor Y)